MVNLYHLICLISIIFCFIWVDFVEDVRVIQNIAQTHFPGMYLTFIYMLKLELNWLKNISDCLHFHGHYFNSLRVGLFFSLWLLEQAYFSGEAKGLTRRKKAFFASCLGFFSIFVASFDPLWSWEVSSSSGSTESDLKIRVDIPELSGYLYIDHWYYCFTWKHCRIFIQSIHRWAKKFSQALSQREMIWKIESRSRISLAIFLLAIDHRWFFHSHSCN